MCLLLVRQVLKSFDAQLPVVPYSSYLAKHMLHDSVYHPDHGLGLTSNTPEVTHLATVTNNLSRLS